MAMRRFYLGSNLVLNCDQAEHEAQRSAPDVRNFSRLSCEFRSNPSSFKTYL